MTYYETWAASERPGVPIETAPPHDFLGHLIVAECPGIGGAHDGEEGGARPFLLAAEDGREVRDAAVRLPGPGGEAGEAGEGEV